MKFNFAYFFFVVWFIGINCSNDELKKSNFKVTFDEVGEILEDENDPNSYFELIRMGKTDIDGNIYILDEDKAAVLKFDKEGNFLKKIGRAGRGPGELERPRTMLVDSEIIIINGGTKRVDVFSLNGEYKASYGEGDIEVSTELVRKGKEFWAFSVPFASNLDSTYILSRYDNEFNLIANNEINAKVFFDEYTREDANVASGAVNSILFTDSSTMVAALPDIYSGHLTKFKKKNDKWEFDNRIKGKNIEQPYELLSDRDGADYLTFVFDKVYNYNLLSQSIGLFELQDGQIVHFLQLDVNNSDSLEYGIELYNQDLEYQGYQAFYKGSMSFGDEDFFSNGGMYLNYIHHKDKNDLFYVVSRGEMGDKISIRELKISFE